MAKRKPKPCDCLSQINEKLEEAGEVTRVDEAMMMNFKTGKVSGYRAKLAVIKSDTKSRKRLKPVVAVYCPFCGKKYT